MTGRQSEVLFASACALALGAVAVGAFGWAALSVGASALGWMREGLWQHGTVADFIAIAGFDRPSVSWVGVNSVVQWLLSFPFFTAPALVGALAMHWSYQCGLESDRLATETP